MGHAPQIPMTTEDLVYRMVLLRDDGILRGGAWWEVFKSLVPHHIKCLSSTTLTRSQTNGVIQRWTLFYFALCYCDKHC